MKKWVLLIVAGLLVFSAGCANSQGAKQEKQKSVHMKAEVPPQFRTVEADKAEQTAKQVRGVDDATAVLMDNELSVAVKVTNFQRLRLKQIRQDVHGRLKKEFSLYKVHVTSDSKLFKELQALKKKIKSGKFEVQKVSKKFKKINEDMKG